MKMIISVVLVLIVLAVSVCATSVAQEKNAVQVPVEKAMQQATWHITAAWNNGVSGSYDITFRDDGTLIAGGGLRGRWFQIERKYVWAFEGVTGVPDWSITYAGDVAANGTTLSGIEGWSNTSGHPKGTHSGVRAFTFVTDAAKLTQSSPSVAVGQEKKK